MLAVALTARPGSHQGQFPHFYTEEGGFLLLAGSATLPQ